MPAYAQCNASQSVNEYLSYSLPGLISIDIFRQELIGWKLALEVIYIFVATLQFVLSVVLNLLMIETLLQKKIRITTCGIYLLIFSFTSLIEMSIFYLRIIVTLYFNEQLDKNSSLHCRLSAAALDWSFFVSLWSCSFVAVERVLIQCFQFSIYRSRKCCLIISLLCIIITATAASATWFLNSQSTIHPVLPTMYLCKMPSKLPPTWKLVHQIIASVYIHLVIPWILHVLSSVCILIHIIRRKAILTDAERSEWLTIMCQQLKKHENFFIPPVAIITMTMPRYILNKLLNSNQGPCRNYDMDVYLRMRIAFGFLYFLPQTIGFFIYIYPSSVYMNRFRETWTVKTVKRIKMIIFQQSSNTNTPSVYIIGSQSAILAQTVLSIDRF